MKLPWPCLLLFLTIAVACTAAVPPQPETVVSWKPATWFESASIRYEVSPDGTNAVGYGPRSELLLFDLSTGQTDQEKLLAGLDRVWRATFYGEGKMARFGQRGDERGWFKEGPDGLVLSSLPNRVLSWAPDDSRIAFSRRNELFVGLPEEPKSYEFDGAVLGAVWSPDGRFIYSLIWKAAEGFGALFRITVESGETQPVMEPLDIPIQNTSLGISSDGNLLYLALASEGAPDPEERHNPDADRDLDIYELDLQTDQLQVVVHDPGDDFYPTISDGWLYWTHNDLRESIVIVPVSGGETRLVVNDAEIPYWHPNGKRIAFTYGGFRIADWGLNLDAAVVDLDEDGNAVSSKIPIVVGYHEDFTPVWSPDGRWIAYHSHRSERPVSSYSAEGSTDDIYLRRSSDSNQEEIRLTDFGWEVLNPDWSPDGRKLLLTSWSREERGSSHVWVVTINPNTGEPIKADKLPVPEGIDWVSDASYSPTGRIALIERIGGRKQALWILSEDGSEAEKLLEFNSSTFGGLDWTPDGENIVYGALTEGQMQLFTIPWSGGEPRQLTADNANLMHPQVSPDGRWIACTRMDQSKELRRLKLR